jgi:hypothetical protein
MMENQLKFNLNSIVNNLNLVNYVHQPAAIIFDNNQIRRKTFQYYGRNGGGGELISNNDDENYQFIDEQKMKMYSFLAARDLKEKERFNRYNLSIIQQNVIKTDNKALKKETKEPKTLNNKVKSTQKQKIKSPIKQNRPLTENVTTESLDTFCSTECVGTIEFLEKQLTECNITPFLVQLKNKNRIKFNLFFCYCS